MSICGRSGASCCDTTLDTTIQNISPNITQFLLVLQSTNYIYQNLSISNSIFIATTAINFRYSSLLSYLIHFQHPRMCPDFHQILIIGKDTSSFQRHSCNISNIGRERKLTKIFVIQFSLNFRQSDTDDIFMFRWQKLCQCRVIFSLNSTIQSY